MLLSLQGGTRHPLTGSMNSYGSVACTSARCPASSTLPLALCRAPAVTEHFLRHEYLQHDYRDRVADIRCPTLLLGGELDPIVPIDEIEDTARRMRPGLAKVVRFPEAGHGTAGINDAILELVRDFVLEDA